MNNKVFIPIWKAEEYSYPLAFDFRPGMHAYLHDDGSMRPVMIVVPGGAYKMVSPAESWSVGHKFYDAGYNVFIFTYTTNYFLSKPLYDLPRTELARAVRLIKRDADAYNADPDRIAVCGFSAGGHLTASLLVHHADTPDPDEELNGISARPGAAVLSYPVISSGRYAHTESLQALLGRNIYECTDLNSLKLLHYNSLEEWVTKDVSPVYIWHTISDDVVPVENTLMFEQALRDNGVLHAMHLYSHGPHGLSSSDEEWSSRVSDDMWCLDQMGELIKAGASGNMSLTDQEKKVIKDDYDDYINRGPMARDAVKEVSGWCREAIDFLDEVWSVR